jgi:hypothetical protein
MSDVTIGRDAGVTPGAHQQVQDHRFGTAVAQGAAVMTLDGLLPVEYLSPGDRIVTRSGAARLRAVQMHLAQGPLIRLAPGGLGHELPVHVLFLSPETQVLLRDWRAEVLYGSAQAMVQAGRLIDGDYITQVPGERARLFTLEFDVPQVIYVDNVEIGCGAVGMATAAA